MTDATHGDMHANALLLLYFLVFAGIVTLSREDYEIFSNIYTRPDLQLRWKGFEPFPAPIYSSATQRETLSSIYTQYLEVLQGIKVVDTQTRIRFIGDEVVDRGVSDYFVLKLLQLLHLQGANFEILASNHGIEFIEACEFYKENSNQFIVPRFKTVIHGNSMFAMVEAIRDEVIDSHEVLDLYNLIYKNHLKMLSYSLDIVGNAIYVYSHAGIGLNHIQGLAKKLKVDYLDQSAMDLARTIDAINSAFREKVKAGKVHTLYTNEMMFQGYSGISLDDYNQVVAATVWGRDYRGLVRTTSAFNLVFVHGHDSDDPDQTHHVTLNEELGKYSWYEGTFKMFCTNGQV